MLLAGTADAPWGMRLPGTVSRELRRRLLDGDLPAPVLAVVGLADQAASTGREVLHHVTTSPADLRDTVVDGYQRLVLRGQDRSVEMAADRAVRARVGRMGDTVAPRAARATVRWNERRKRWVQSPTAHRAATARDRARSAAHRFQQMNAPVLISETDGPQPQ